MVGAQPIAEVPDVGAREVMEERVGRPVAVADTGRHQEDLTGRPVAAPEEGDGAMAGGVVERFDERGAGAGHPVPERLGQGVPGGGVPGGFELPGEPGHPWAGDRPGGVHRTGLVTHEPAPPGRSALPVSGRAWSWAWGQCGSSFHRSVAGVRDHDEPHGNQQGPAGRRPAHLGSS